MLLVATEVKPSRIHGDGLFVTQFVPKGAEIWRYSPEVDKVYTVESLHAASEEEKNHLLTYAYYCRRIGGYVMCGDNARFVNHCEDPTITGGADGLSCIARVDLHPGDELTEDYRTYDEDPLVQWNALFDRNAEPVKAG